MTLTLADDRPPIPPADLILRVAPSFGPGSLDANLRAFDVGALGHLQSFERALGVVGRSFADFDRLLDFGCGCGRFLRHLGSLAGRVEIHGTDIDADMIAWLRSNVPYGRYEIAPHDPPLPYADHHFDLVINHSVFTHLDERRQDLWLRELQRVSRPDGLLLLTVEGTSSWNRTRKAHQDQDISRWQDELESRGILFIADDAFVGSTHPSFYHSTFHAPWYIFEHWSKFFDLVAYLPDGSDSQDLVVLRHRGDSAVPPQPIRARALGSPGEATGLAHGGRSALGTLRRYIRFRRLNSETVNREMTMLRAGLYEQGNRISMLAAELRKEIDAVRRDNGAS